jgi:molybdate transport system permease protein
VSGRSFPRSTAALAIAGALFVALPIIGLAVRAPWSRAWSVVSSEQALTALRVSLIVATLAAGFAFVLGAPLALALARSTFRGRTLVRAIVILPLVLPPVVAGVGLLAALGRRGLIGSLLDRWFGITLPFTTAAAVIAATFVSIPLLVLAVEAGVRGLDPRLEHAAAAMGGSPWYVLRRVTLPLVGPQVAAGLVLAWARALGEFGATLMFAGNLEGRTQTLPLAVFQVSQTDPEGSYALSIVLVSLSLLVLVALRRRFLGPIPA